jgi:hypothetical protein
MLLVVVRFIAKMYGTQLVTFLCSAVYREYYSQSACTDAFKISTLVYCISTLTYIS